MAATYVFDSRGDLTSSDSSLHARELTRAYDLAGSRGTEVDPTGTTTCTPDALNRYTSIAGQQQEPGLAYDADGDLTQRDSAELT